MLEEIVCLLRGASDEPLHDLEGKTPLEKAQTKNLARILERASKGSFSADFPNIESAFFQFLRAEKMEKAIYPSPLEYSYLGYHLSSDQLCYSLRFASTGQGILTDLSDELLSEEEAKQLSKLVSQAFKPLKMHCFHLSGPNALLLGSKRKAPFPLEAFSLKLWQKVGLDWLSLYPSSLDPEWLEAFLRFQKLAEASEINLLREDLEEDFLNAVLISSFGPALAVYPPEEKRTLFCSQKKSLLALAKNLGCECLELPREKNKFDNMHDLVRRLDDLRPYFSRLIIDLPYLWQSTFKGDLLAKIKGMEYLDKYFLGPLMDFSQSAAVNLTLTPLCHSSIAKGELLAGAVPLIQFTPARNRLLR